MKAMRFVNPEGETRIGALGEDGTITPNEVMVQAVPAMLDELLKLEEALAPLRAE